MPPSHLILPSQCLECGPGLKAELVILPRGRNPGKEMQNKKERTLFSEDRGAALSFPSGFFSRPKYHHYTISCSTLLKCSKGISAYKLYTNQVDTHYTLFGKDELSRAYGSPEDLVKIRSLFQ